MKANTGKLFNWFWGTSAKQICKRVQEYSTPDLFILLKATSKNTGGPQAIQHQFIIKELRKRISK